MTADKITIRFPRDLPSTGLPVRRLAIGSPGDYKPMIVQLDNGELLITAFRIAELDVCLPDGRPLVHEDVLLFRSTDRGRTWSEPYVPDMVFGREPYISVLSDGTLLMTTHLSGRDHRNPSGRVKTYVHRSVDRGRTWHPQHIVPEHYPPDIWIHSSRNVLELDDGTLIMGVSGYDVATDLLYCSTDKGLTWTVRETKIVDKPTEYPWPFWAEAVFWQSRSGKLLALCRVSQEHWPIEGRPASQSSHNDQCERLLLLSSSDHGTTWGFDSDLGDYGMMYPSLLRLADGRILLTYTVRSLDLPLGVRAVLGIETNNSLAFDFSHDVIIIDEKTPSGQSSGGGFGNTLQLKDGSLLTPYSFRNADTKDPRGVEGVYLEVAAWRLL